MKKAQDDRRKEEEKAKKGKKKGKGKDAEPEEAAKTPVSPVKSVAKTPVFDKESQQGFKDALEHHVKRPFLFGPVEYEGLDLTDEDEPFAYEDARQKAISILERGVNISPNLCSHGYRVLVKGRNLKRRSSLLKHARFLRNLEVTPNMPPIKEEEAPAESGEE